MKLTYLSQSYFPFAVPEMGPAFAANVGAQTVYPAGFSLGIALQLYWRAKNYRLVAAGVGALDPLTQSLSVNDLVPPRNAAVGTNSYAPLDGFSPTGPADLVPGRGLRQIVPGSGTISASGPDSGTNPAGLFNVQVNLFYPEVFAPNPVVKYDGLWWPAMSLSCSVENTVELESGGELSLVYACTTLPDPASTALIGACSFFGQSVPVYCPSLDPAETRTFTGTLTVEEEWP